MRRRGGQVIVINPVVETGLVQFSVPSDVQSLLFGSKIASLYVQPHIGGDLALLTGIAKRIVEIGAHDEAFLNESLPTAGRSCERGWQTVSWDEIVAKSGVSRDEIDDDRRATTPRPRTSSSVGRWASRTTPTACRTCRRSPTWRCCAAWSAGRAAG